MNLGYRLTFGGYANNGDNAGLFACNLNYSATNANNNLGCRLAIHARSRFFMECRTARDLGFVFRTGQ